MPSAQLEAERVPVAVFPTKRSSVIWTQRDACLPIIPQGGGTKQTKSKWTTLDSKWYLKGLASKIWTVYTFSFDCHSQKARIRWAGRKRRTDGITHWTHRSRQRRAQEPLARARRGHGLCLVHTSSRTTFEPVPFFLTSTATTTGYFPRTGGRRARRSPSATALHDFQSKKRGDEVTFWMVCCVTSPLLLGRADENATDIFCHVREGNKSRVFYSNV